MDINTFIEKLAEQYFETPLEEFHADTDFRQFSEWSSMTGLSILSMIKDEFGFFLDPKEMKACKTVQELYDLVQSKVK